MQRADFPRAVGDLSLQRPICCVLINVAEATPLADPQEPAILEPHRIRCAVDPCTEVARFVVAVAASRDGSIRAARRCCAEHLEEAVFWAEGLVGVDPRARYALINRWGPWALELHEVPA